MALNFSHLPIPPSNPSEDNFASSFWFANGYFVNGIPDKNVDVFGRSPHVNWEVEDSYDYRRDNSDWGGSCEPVSNDILDILPSDPFGMDISATVTALTGWLENLEVEDHGFRWDEIRANKVDCRLVAGLDVIRNRAMRCQAEPGTTGVYESILDGSFNGRMENKGLGDGLCDTGFVSVSNVEEVLIVGDEDSWVANCRTKELEGGAGSCSDGGGEEPHEALQFALCFLGVQDLLSVERVCRSLRDAVRNDSLLWRRIYINQPLSEKITDYLLLKLTSRSQENLQCLSLVECARITDDGLKRVLESNPKLTKLSMPGCSRMNIDGIMNNLKVFKASGKPGIKLLRIGGLYGVTQKHFEELKCLLGTENHLQLKADKPRFYQSEHLYLSCYDDRAIDIELCPRCQNFRPVYDCPAENCQGKQHATELCRACILCIERCIQCGRCFNDREYVETFCLDLLCANCWKQLLIGQEEKDAPSKHSFFPQETRCHSSFCG